MTAHRNIYACLVHEKPECVADLVHNLRHLDPASLVLLYNGGPDAALLKSFANCAGVIVYPRPRRMRWGRLHDFALDCMRFAIEHLPFDSITIVDSDQLALRAGYSPALGDFLARHPDAGMLGSAPGPQPASTRIGPAVAALREASLWRNWLQQFPNGEQAFVHWTFWPSTVFTAAACRDLVRLFDGDTGLQAIMRRSRIWATEEVILPTLTALLGYRIVLNPASYEYVQYRVSYSPAQLSSALDDPAAFWMHPVPREQNHSLRHQIRRHFDDYCVSASRREPMVARSSQASLVLTLPILQQMRSIEGWLEDDEADLLIAAAQQALRSLPTAPAIVEIGSYCGRSTVVLASVVREMASPARVYAIDPHTGQVGAAGQNLHQGTPTFERFQRNIGRAELDPQVVSIRQHSYEVNWNQPISLLLIDGLHDYDNVARDVAHFAPWVAAKGYIAFHDYADYYPGVRLFVDELLQSDEYHCVALARSLMLVQKLASTDGSSSSSPNGESRPVSRISSSVDASAGVQHTLPVEGPATPLVSCIMPTRNRRAFVPRALAYFARQDYANRELIIIDDGSDPVADLIPDDPHIRYLRQARPLSLGNKRNLACRQAHGSIIAHWDDDDWMADWRLSYQVAQLLASGADICGLASLLFYCPRSEQAWRYTYPGGGKPWVAGGTLCYRRSFWERHPFQDITIGEDTRFVWSSSEANIVALSEPNFYVALIHARNTAAKHTTSRRWQAVSLDLVAELLGPEMALYRTATTGQL